MIRRMIVSAALVAGLLPLQAEALALVENGEPLAIVVTADDPSPVAAYAAKELVEHIGKATGAVPPVIRESDAEDDGSTRIYVGETAAARGHGINPGGLGNDVSVMRVVEGDLYILGREDGGNPHGQMTLRGTLYGVYEFLERFVKVHWLWPGELGTHVPRTDTLALDASLDEMFEPALRFRRARFYHIQRHAENPDPAIARIGITDEAALDYVTPNISTWQAGEFFKFAWENGMEGFGYDSLIGHWAAKGPMLYIHMRLFADPEAGIADIREEYFEAFGSAAEHVERYFDYWEKYSGVRGANPIDVVEAYRPAVFEPARKMLAEAMKAAPGSTETRHGERVEFLQAGLEHAVLAANFVRSTDRGKVPDVAPGAFGDDGFLSAAELPKDARRFAETRQALLDLIAFRREHEHLFFADLIDAAQRENQRIDIDRLLVDPKGKNEIRHRE